MQYDFTLPPGGGMKIDAKGRFFKYRSGTGLIRVRASRGGYVDLMPGQGVSNMQFDSLMVSDLSGAKNAGVIIAGDFDFRDDRISGKIQVDDTSPLGVTGKVEVTNVEPISVAGKVEVLDDTAKRVLSKAAYAVTARSGLSGWEQAQGVKDEKPGSERVQLWNPRDSNVYAVVEQISILSDSSGLIRWSFANFDIGTPPTGSANYRADYGTPAGKSMIGRSPIQTKSSNGPIAGFEQLGVTQVEKGKLKIIELKSPIICRPMSGLTLTSESEMKDGFFAVFDFYHLPL